MTLQNVHEKAIRATHQRVTFSQHFCGKSDEKVGDFGIDFCIDNETNGRKNLFLTFEKVRKTGLLDFLTDEPKPKP